MDDRRRAFRVVDAFEEELAAYCGSRFAVTVDSCTNAIYLALRCRLALGWENVPVLLPSHTYVGVVQAARNAGLEVRFRDECWQGSYRVEAYAITDSAKCFERDMHRDGDLTCLSFQAGKRLPIGRGGAILTDSEEVRDWLCRARLDGRTAGADYSQNTYQREGHHMYLPPDAAARGLWLLTYIDDDDQGDWTEYPNISEAQWT